MPRPGGRRHGLAEAGRGGKDDEVFSGGLLEAFEEFFPDETTFRNLGKAQLDIEEERLRHRFRLR